VIPNPWLILAALASLAGAYWFGAIEGHTAERAHWEKLVADQKLNAAKALADATAKARAREIEIAALKDQIEERDREALRTQKAADDRLRKLIAANGGLRDKAARCGGGDGAGLPENPGPAGGGAGASAGGGCVLSDGVSQDLRALADRAADVLRAARAAQRYAIGVKSSAQ
jgi:hypothetical protein